MFSTYILGFAALSAYATAATVGTARVTQPVSLSQQLSIDVASVPSCAVSQPPDTQRVKHDS